MSFWRLLLLASFCAVGIGLALCVASSAPAPSSPASPADAMSLAVTTEGSNSATESAVNHKTPTSEAVGLARPEIEQASSRIAAQANEHEVLLAQANPPATDRSLSVSPTDLMNAAKMLEQSKLLDALQGAGSDQSSSALSPNQAPTMSSTAPPMSQSDVMQKLREQLQRALQMRQSASGGEQLPSPQEPGSSGLAPSSETPAAANPAARPSKSKPRIVKMPGEGDNNLSIHIQDSDLRDVLELLSEQGDLNILPSPSVQGKVSASLTGVNIDKALNAILRSTGFISKRDGNFIYVGTPQDFKAMAQSIDTVGTRVYHLSYIRAADVQALIQPLLTPGIGTSSVTQPADEGIGADTDKAGGNQYANSDAVVVHDYVAVLNQVDQVIAEVDRKPAQVAIDAMILKVTLDDKYSFGVDMAFLRNNPNVRLFTGSPLSSLAAAGPNGGLSFAYLDSSTAAFVTALEQIGDTNIIASPHLMVIDKARAQILIGNQDGYINSTITETSTAQNVQFLETGAQLRLRPYITADGMVRMEVHPELSTGTVEVTAGPNPLTLPHKDVTQVTTNIMIPDGCTVVIGGLMRDELDTTTQQIPLLGSLPGIGFLFRTKNEETAKKEIIVLITPHIVCDCTAGCEGDRVAAEFHRRQAVYADQMSPLGKRYLGRRFYRLAQAAWAKHDQEAALRFVDCAIHFDPLDRAAIDLRVDIWNGNLTGEHTLLSPPLMAQQEMMGMPGRGPMMGVPDGMLFSEPGQAEPIPRGVPFGNPPSLNGEKGAPTTNALPAPSVVPPQPSGNNPSNGAAPRKLENPSQGQPFPQDAQSTPVPSASESSRSDTAVRPASLVQESGGATTRRLNNQLDGNRISPWILNQLKESKPADAAAASGNSTTATAAPVNAH